MSIRNETTRAGEELGTDVGAAIGTALGGPIGTMIGTNIGKAAGEVLGGAVGGAFEAVGGLVGKALSAVGGLIGKALGAITEVMSKTLGAITTAVSNWSRASGRAREGLKDQIRGAATTGLFQKGLEAVNRSLELGKKALDSAERSYYKLTEAVTKVGVLTTEFATKPLKMLAAGIDALNAPALLVTGTLGKFQNSITAVGNAASQFTQLANPALTQRFRFAADDLTASIGRALIPVLKAATTITRGFADVVFALSGPIQRLGNAFEPLVNLVPRFTNALGPIVSGVNTFTRGVADALRPINEVVGLHFEEALNTLAGAFKALWATMRPGIELTAQMAAGTAKLIAALSSNPLGRFFNGTSAFGRTGPSISGSSTGAAVRNAGFSSSEQYHNKLITTAFSLGTASTEEKMASDVALIKGFLESLPGRMWEAFKALPGSIALALVEFIGQLVDRIKPPIPGKETAKEIGTAARDASRWLDKNKFAGATGLAGIAAQHLGLIP